MTDPFSVGAGVVGVLSLGITVCQGLTAYYGPFSQFDSETKALVQKAEGLTSTLQQLESLLKPFQNPLNSPLDEVHLVTQRIKDCRDELEGLSHALTKCRGCDATTVIKKSGWYYARKVLYPFKRGTIISLTGTVSNLQSNLDTALLVLNLALFRRLEDQTTLNLSVSKSIAAGTTDISTTLTRIEHGQQQIFQAIQSFQKAGVSSPRALPPATLRSLCNQQQAVNRQVRRYARLRHVPKSKTASCTCPQGSPRHWKFFPMIQSHRFGCPLYFYKEEMTLFHGRYTFCNRFLGFSIQFSMNAISGAGGFTIHPFLDVRRVVRNDAPAFKLLYDFLQYPNLEALRLNGQSADRFLRQLQKLFEDGEASPMDTWSDGTTLLHFTIGRWMFVDDVLFDFYREIIKTLALIHHVPINEGCSRYGEVYTPLDLLFRATAIPFWTSATTFQGFATLVLDLLANGGEVTEPTLSSSLGLLRTTRLLLPRVVNELCLQGLGLSDIEIAILTRSEVDLNRLSDNHPEEDITVKYAVFLSMVEWPLGLELILKWPPMPYTKHEDVLSEAVAGSHKDSLCLLLAAGWPISSDNFNLAAVAPDKLEMFRILVDSLITRRRRLLTLAREKLCPRELALHANIDDLSGESTKIVYELLAKTVPGICQTIVMGPEESFRVYESIGHNSKAADILYEAGFLNLEEGHSPISSLGSAPVSALSEYLDMCSWFQNKGVSLYSQSSETESPIHKIAETIGYCLDNVIVSRNTRLHSAWRIAVSRHATLLKDVLKDTEHRDSCSCACSVGGCLPSTIPVRHAIRRLSWRFNPTRSELFDFLDSVAPGQVKEMHDILAPVVLRLCTFERLEITHTCARHLSLHSHRGVEICDVPEIKYEQRYLINRLDELVTEFEGKYKELNVLLPEFLCGYWRDRMDEVKAEEEVFDEEEAQRMREIGVIVECPSSDSE